jgi:adenylate cyclase
MNLFAQYNSKSADSVLQVFQTDESQNFNAKILEGDTLLNLFEKYNKPCKWMEVLIRKSHYQSLAGNSNDALNSVNEVFDRYQAGICKNSMLLPEIYLAYGRVYIHLNSNEKARSYIEKGIASWKGSYPKKSIIIELLNNKGNLYQELDSQVYYILKAYQLSVGEDDLLHQQLTLSDLGYAFAYEENFEEAKLYFQKALKVAHQREAYNAMSIIYNNLAGVSDDNRTIAEYLDSAIYYAKLKGNIDAMQTALQNSALFNYDNERYKKGYDDLWESTLLRDSLFNRNKIYAFAEMEQKFQSELKEQKISYLNEQNKSKTKQRNGFIMGSLLLLAFAVVAVIQRNKVNKERKRSDNLLLNILPDEVAEELKRTGEAEAKQYNHVTVLFTDFVNFTGISEQMSPTELVKEIHRNFTAYDAIIERNGLEKIKTIGDAYLAVCGLPKTDDNHAQKVVRAAIELKDWMVQNEGKFKVRIGINSGPVVAGIVGVKKYAYDIWGDTVNLAARMEQNSEPGKINISSNTYELVKNQFRCEQRGKIAAKGKGEIDMYFVE